MSQDVQFFKDNLPSWLTTIDVSILAVSIDILNKFVNNALAKNKSIVIRSWPESTSDIPSVPMNVIDTNSVLSDIYPIISSFNNTSKILSSLLLALKRSSKWIDLSKRNVLGYVCKPIEWYGLITIDNAIMTSKSVTFAFITVENKPKTYKKALCFPFST